MLHNLYFRFYNRGLGGKDEVNEKGWNMKTLRSIMTELGHQNVRERAGASTCRGGWGKMIRGAM